jgi:hypothetical protein
VNIFDGGSDGSDVTPFELLSLEFWPFFLKETLFSKPKFPEFSAGELEVRELGDREPLKGEPPLTFLLLLFREFETFGDSKENVFKYSLKLIQI